jgi:hypothetical protein
MIESLREIWHYRPLIGELVRRDLKLRYKNSVGGILWSLASPLMQIFAITLLLRFIAARQSLMAQYICLSSSLGTFSDHAFLNRVIQFYRTRVWCEKFIFRAPFCRLQPVIQLVSFWNGFYIHSYLLFCPANLSSTIRFLNFAGRADTLFSVVFGFGIRVYCGLS